MLDTFDNTLLPLIKGFDGALIKSIGDAMLLTFKSPTDAMLCSMAMQDAMHEHNLHAERQDERIHIRVAAHLGEVRLAKKDIFGEPVNVASRIEGVTPADEIYLSEAVYMAMNKAEVPAQEAGFHRLKGIEQEIRLYSIPRFSEHRLVPSSIEGADQQSELLYPYGGMQYRIKHATATLPSKRQLKRALLPLALAGGAAALIALIWQLYSEPQSSDTPTPFAQLLQSTATSPAPEAALPDNASARQSANRGSASDAAIASSTPQATATSTDAPAPLRQNTRDASPATNRDTLEPQTPRQPQTQTQTTDSDWNVRSAKQAYRDGQLSRDKYKAVIAELKRTYKARAQQLKQDYRDEKIDREQYRRQLAEAKRIYSGNSQ